jgi:thiamine-monophosphate kinase
MVGVADQEAVLRSRAVPGDAICVTGSLGGAAGGLYLLQNEAGDRSSELVARQLRPQVRADEGVRIAAAGAHAMIDISDGFLLDLSRLLRAGGVGCRVDPALVPIDPHLAALQDMPRAPQPRGLALSGGEDFELLFTIDTSRLDKVRTSLESLGTEVTIVGEVVEGDAMIGDLRLDDLGERGWDHLKDL